MRSRQVLNILPREVKEAVDHFKLTCEHLQEIRIRIGQPVLFLSRGKEIVTSMIATEKMLRETISFSLFY